MKAPVPPPKLFPPDLDSLRPYFSPDAYQQGFETLVMLSLVLVPILLFRWRRSANANVAVRSFWIILPIFFALAAFGLRGWQIQFEADDPQYLRDRWRPGWAYLAFGVTASTLLLVGHLATRRHHSS
jgi:hypothetical protein